MQDHEQLTEVYYLQSMVFHTLGEIEKREVAATLFRKYTLALSEAQAQEGSFQFQ